VKRSRIINYPLGLLGLQVVSKKKLAQLHEIAAVSDIEKDIAFLHLYEKVKDFTMTGMVRTYSLYQSMKYIIGNDIKGDFAECGVWKGGSCMLMAYMLAEAGVADRHIYLYDTFAGMTKPGPMDGHFETKEWERQQRNEKENDWCYSPASEVKANLQRTGFPERNLHFIEGKVEETIPATMPSRLAMLRLDTDWYASTRHELVHLYPLLSAKGVLLVDDYGAWEGARRAVDEYFAGNTPVLMNRIDWTGRLIIKPAP
jgi:hypothetical protein